MIDGSSTLGVILAGGLARRMGGGDKALLKIGGITILERVLGRFLPQCAVVIINANGDPLRFSFTGLQVVADQIPDFAGPLAGILASLDWAHKNAKFATHIASVPGDCPFLPDNLVARLHEVRLSSGLPLSCAQSGTWRHPVAGLWPVSLRENLRRALYDEQLHKIEVWTSRHGVAIAEWQDQPVDPFFNVNSPSDVISAEAMLTRDVTVRSPN